MSKRSLRMYQPTLMPNSPIKPNETDLKLSHKYRKGGVTGSSLIFIPSSIPLTIKVVFS